MFDKKISIKSKPGMSEGLLPLSKKIKHLATIRHEIKKKRLVLDEGKDKFGCEEMTQLMKVTNVSQIKGYPFSINKGILSSKTHGMKLALKIVPIEIKYEKNEHPCSLENIILKELSENVVSKFISPHITYYLGTQKVSNKSRAVKFLNLKRLEVEEQIRGHSNMLIAEFVEGGSLDNWIFNTYENDGTITDEQWKSIVFQLVYTIAVLQEKYKMMHNDFHYGNILMDDMIEPVGYLVYEINGKTYYIKNTGIIPKTWDYEFAMVYSDKIPGCYPNKFIVGGYNYDNVKHVTQVDTPTDDTEIHNVPYNFNKVYDLHYFLTSLLDLYISQELFDWIISLYPEELIPEETHSTVSNSQSNEAEQTTSDTGSDTGSDTTSDTGSETQSDTRSDTVSDTGSDTRSDTGSDTTSDTGSETRSDTTSSTKSAGDVLSDFQDTETMYLHEGRMLNGVEEMFSNLPQPLSLLGDAFFNSFTTKPEDFDESTAIYFKAGF